MPRRNCWIRYSLKCYCSTSTSLMYMGSVPSIGLGKIEFDIYFLIDTSGNNGLGTDATLSATVCNSWRASSRLTVILSSRKQGILFSKNTMFGNICTFQKWQRSWTCFLALCFGSVWGGDRWHSSNDKLLTRWFWIKYGGRIYDFSKKTRQYTPNGEKPTSILQNAIITAPSVLCYFTNRAFA